MTESELPEEYHPYILQEHDMPDGETILCCDIGEDSLLNTYGSWTIGKSYKLLSAEKVHPYGILLLLTDDLDATSTWNIQNFTLSDHPDSLWLRQDLMPEKLLFKLLLMM